MAAPNLVSVSSIYGKSVGQELNTTTTTGILTCAADKCLKINSIIVANIDGTNAADATVNFYDNSMTRRNPLASTVSVPADSTLIVLGKYAHIYLEEGHSIRGGASANSDAEVLICYEILDDA